ncbi:MAG: protein phosphatase 2C domain-containing protein [Deltaproteobacteria bacterium]|nr:protein phosphatase 2C domain-containing protein [Deltaproteobacteria bacterium]
MDTNSQIRAAAAAVIGSRHLKAARNGQDAAAVWIGDGAGAVVVCDGCGSSGSSEVGARIGARLVIAALSRRLSAGGSASDAALWAGVRDEVVFQINELVNTMLGTAVAQECFARETVLREYFLFTIVAGAVAGNEAAVWALGDGGFAINGRARELGPFEDNQPPYLAYDLLGMPQTAVLEVVPAIAAGTIVVATDGIAEVGLDAIAVERCLAHPDALRRRLAVLARAEEKIEWDARRVVRAPAALQDDGAVAILAWRGSPS